MVIYPMEIHNKLTGKRQKNSSKISMLEKLNHSMARLYPFGLKYFL
jgi:hypothetical protein